MPSATFTSLKPDKRRRVEDALLHEFSVHPLAEAQVARIVHDAGIARGAFYVYFADLADAYRHLLGIALGEIHGGLVDAWERRPEDSLAAVYDYTFGVARQMSGSPYRDLFRLHWQVNESHLACQANDTTPASPAPAADERPEHFLAGHPLVIDGHELHDDHRTAVVVALLMQISHQCIQDVLAGRPADAVMSDFATVLDLLRAGLLQEVRPHVPRA